MNILHIDITSHLRKFSIVTRSKRTFIIYYIKRNAANRNIYKKKSKKLDRSNDISVHFCKIKPKKIIAVEQIAGRITGFSSY